MTTRVTTTAAGGVSIFSVPFPYLSRAHVFVEINGGATSDYAWTTESTIDLDDVVDGNSVYIYRDTPDDALVEYQSGPTLTKADLEMDSLQAIYLIQELRDDLLDATFDEDSEVITNLQDQIDALEARIAALELITANFNRLQTYCVALSDEETPIEAGVNVGRFVTPYPFTVVGVMGSLKVAQTSGSLVTLDANRTGVGTILSTKVTIDNGEKNSKTGAAQFVLTGAIALTSGEEVTFDIDQVGDGTAIGAQVAVWGYQTPGIAFP